MALKRAQYYTYGEDALCAETRKFVEDAGIIVDLRDIEKMPFTVDELNRLIGHININHFLNPFSDAYTKYKLDSGQIPRSEILRLMASDHTLIKRPILKTTRLMTVGCDRRKIAEMLQVTANGNGNGDESGKNGGNQKKSPEQASAGK